MNNWLLSTPLAYDPANPNWWKRNMGLLALSLRELGVNARLLTHGPTTLSPDRPHIQDSTDRLSDPAWWREQKAEVVIWGGGNNRRLLPAVRAIHASKARLFLMMDSDGLIDPWENTCKFFITTAGKAMDHGRRFPFFRAAAKILIGSVFPSYTLKSVADHLVFADGAFVVTPLAAVRLQHFLARQGRADLAARIHFLPHAVTGDMIPGRRSKRPNQIVAVGRWDARQKNTPLLLEALRRTLSRHADYRALIIGSGEDAIRARLSHWPVQLRSRLDIRGPVNHVDLHDVLQSSRICLVTSRWESFHIGAAEALCCGCSVVGPAMIPSIPYFASRQSGTAAGLYTADDLSNSLLLEMDAWETGQRDPEAIGKTWGQERQASHVAEKMIRIVASPPGG